MSSSQCGYKTKSLEHGPLSQLHVKSLKSSVSIKFPEDNFLMCYLPEVNTVPLVAPNIDITTPKGIRKLAGPKTSIPQSLRDI